MANPQQSAHEFVMVALSGIQHKILSILDGAENQINQQQQQIEELKKKISELSPPEKA